MEDDTWCFGVSTSYRNCLSNLKSQSDLCIDFEEIEEDDGFRIEFYCCPFCPEDFELHGLCVHIDEEHPHEADSGVCPVCATRVRMDMVVHITTEHGSILNPHHRLKFCKANSDSTFSSRKESWDALYQSVHVRSSSPVSSSKMHLDPLLSFLSHVPPPNQSESVQPSSLSEVFLEAKSSDDQMSERNFEPPPLSDKDHMEKTKKCEFIQELLLSTMFDDSL